MNGPTGLPNAHHTLSGLAKALLAVSLVTLSACAAASQPVQQTAQEREVHYLKLAQRYDADRASGMAGVISDVQQCYAQAGGVIVLEDELRDCLLLDGTGAREDRQAFRAFGVSLPFYSRQAKAQRWGHYGQKAGFPTVQLLLAFITNGSQQVNAFRHDRSVGQGK